MPASTPADTERIFPVQSSWRALLFSIYGCRRIGDLHRKRSYHYERPAPRHHRARRRYTLILLVIWTPRPWQRIFYIAAVLWIAAVSILSFNGWRAMGLRLTNSLRSLWIVAASLLLAAAAVLVGIRFHTLRRPFDSEQLIRLYWGYAIWSCLQQFLLQNFFLLRLLRLLPTTLGAVTAATALFALAHLPNPILTSATAIWGFAACLLFLRYRNLFPLAISHIILGVCVAITVPNTLNHNMRVGLGYLHWHPRHAHQLVQPIRTSPARTIQLAPHI
jgi:Type II CAAX prenyl endopeptidase Rce1-like